MDRMRERLVVDNAAVNQVSRARQCAPVLKELICRHPIRTLSFDGRVRDEDGRECSGEARCDSRQLGKRRDHSRILPGIEVGFSAFPVFELKHRAMILHFDNVSGVVHALEGAAVDVRSCNEKIEFLERRWRFTVGGRAFQHAEGAFEFRLIVAFAVENGSNGVFGGCRGSQQTPDVG